MARYTYEIILDADGTTPNELEDFLFESLIMGNWTPSDGQSKNLRMKVSRDDFKGQRCYMTAKENKILETILHAEMPDSFTGSEDDWDDARMLIYNHVFDVITEDEPSEQTVRHSSITPETVVTPNEVRRSLFNLQKYEEA